MSKAVAEQIAKSIYPDKWKDVGQGLMVDQNANLRVCAEAVAEHLLEVLRSDETASAVMHAFFRREHRREPNDDEKIHLSVHMGTALTAVEFQMMKCKDLTHCETNK